MKWKLLFSTVGVVTGVRYNWKGNPCCPGAYEGKKGFSCPKLGCSVYSNRDELPLATFKYEIENNNCVMPYSFV